MLIPSCRPIHIDHCSPLDTTQTRPAQLTSLNRTRHNSLRLSLAEAISLAQESRSPVSSGTFSHSILSPYPFRCTSTSNRLTLISSIEVPHLIPDIARQYFPLPQLTARDIEATTHLGTLLLQRESEWRLSFETLPLTTQKRRLWSIDLGRLVYVTHRHAQRW